ncbi:MAG: dipeptidase [Faecousia sp.]
MKHLRRILCLVLAVVMLSTAVIAASACTTVAAGKNATDNGAVMVAHTCDGWYDHRIQIVEGGKHKAGEVVEIWGDPCTATKNEVTLTGTIPQAEETYTYFNIGYPFMNEKGVVMSEFTWSGDYNNFQNSTGMFWIANLEMLGLQRAATAKEAVQVMGALAEEYGYIDGGECLLVADQNEVWIFEICGPGPLWTPGSEAPGAHWAARRVPDDQVFVGANRSRLGVIDFDDENVLYSTDITVWPEQLGLWKEGEEFNFTNIFNPTPYGYMFYASRREWRAFSLIAPSQEFPVVDRWTHYDFAITPDEPVTKQLIMRDIYSDHLEGTPYDLTQGQAAGPFGNPTRWQVPGSMKPETGEDWERIIAQFRCSYSFVAELRQDMPGEIGSVLWFGEDSPDTTVYVPIYAGTTEVPVEWSTGDRKSFDEDCAWWAFNFVNNYANLNWAEMYPVIRERKFEIEDALFAEQAEVDAKAMELYNKGDLKGAKKYLTEYVCETLNEVNDAWWAFAWELAGTYYDGIQINEDGTSTTIGYPTDWLIEVGYGQTSLDDIAALGK